METPRPSSGEIEREGWNILYTNAPVGQMLNLPSVCYTLAEPVELMPMSVDGEDVSELEPVRLNTGAKFRIIDAIPNSDEGVAIVYGGFGKIVYIDAKTPLTARTIMPDTDDAKMMVIKLFPEETTAQELWDTLENMRGVLLKRVFRAAGLQGYQDLTTSNDPKTVLAAMRKINEEA